jgi:hypothetical protein
LKNYLKEIYDENEHDGFIFMLDEEDQLDISPFTYKEKSDPIESHELGLKYHIIMYRETSDGNLIEPDIFEAILGNPWHYVANLINIGFFGTICKKTKHSLNIVEEMFDDLIDTINLQEEPENEPV